MQWTGAVNNTGTVVALYCTDSFIFRGLDYTVGRTESEAMHFGDKVYHSNPIWIWEAKTNNKEESYERIELGRLIHDEVLEISFEPEDELQRHHRFFC